MMKETVVRRVLVIMRLWGISEDRLEAVSMTGVIPSKLIGAFSPPRLPGADQMHHHLFFPSFAS